MRAILISVVFVLTACSSHSSEKSVRVAAASDLSRAFEEVSKAFTKKTGIKPQFQFGSSGLLAKQIEQGAPFYLFAAANRGFVDQVVKSGKCDGSTAQLYSRGRLVVWGKRDTPAKLEDLADPKYKRIAIANPEHAPYGKAAKEALEKAGLWETVKDRIVPAESVQIAMKYAQDSSTDVAITALSLAIVAEGGKYLAIEPDLHAPLEQTLVVCGTGPEADAARQLAQFIVSPEGTEIMTRFGFSTTGVVR